MPAAWLAYIRDRWQQVHSCCVCCCTALLQAVEDMCRHQMQDRLYKRLQAECDAHIAQQLAGLQSQTQLAPAAFLEQVAAMWDNYCSQMLLIRSIFLYLDRTYVITLPGLRSLFDTGLACLRQHLGEHPKVSSTAMTRVGAFALQALSCCLSTS